MSTITSITRTYYASLFGPEAIQGMRNAGTALRAATQPEFAGSRATLVGDAAKMGARPLGKLIASNFITTGVAMEVIDYVTSRIDNRKREEAIQHLVLKLADPKISDKDRKEFSTRIKEYTVPPRRSFGQFMRDLPPRTLRRVWRTAVFEAGFWYAAVTAPVWIATVALYAVYSFGIILPISVFAEGMGWEFNTDKFTERPGKVVRKIVHHTVGRGWRTMTRATRMTVFNQSAMHNGMGELVLDDISEVLLGEQKLEDPKTAYDFGKQMAHAVMTHEALDQMAKQSALAVFSTWSVDHLSPTYRDQVAEGFKKEVPLYLRDLV